MIEALMRARDEFRKFQEIAYEGEDTERTLDEEYPTHTDELHFTDQSLDEFIICLELYTQNLEELLKGEMK